MNRVITINNELFGSVRFMNIDEQIYAIGKDIADALGYSDSSSAISKHCKNKIKLMMTHIKNNKELKTQTALIPSEDILLLIQKSKTRSIEYKSNFKNWLISEGVISNMSIIESRKELEFIDQLEETLKPFGIKGQRQYHVLTYRIDYYIESLNIAIEYDENNHSCYTYEQHEGRQEKIENELGCRFIRVSDKNSHSYNVGLVIKQMFSI